MYPSLRSQLRDGLRDRADTEGWRALIAQHGTPLLVLDPYRVIEQYRLLASHLRGFRLHYAVKTSPHPAVLRAVAASGGGFDVATNAEIDLLRTLGLPVNRCINTNPIKKLSDIDHAYVAGVRTFVVDNPVEVQKFVGLPADIDILVRLAFRNPSAKSDLSTKFGADPAEAELVVKHVLATGVRFAGFSFHVGSQGTTAEPYREALRARWTSSPTSTKRSACRPGSSTSAAAFRSPTANRCPPIDAIAAVVDEVLGDRRDEFTLLAEPGRFLAADSMTLLTSVVGSAVRDGRMWHYLDDGLYGSYSNVMTEDVHPPILALREVRRRRGRLRAGDAGRTDMRQRRRHRPRLSDAVAERRRRGGQPDDGRLHVGDVVALQRHRRPPRSSKSEFPSARALPATVARPRCWSMAHHDDGTHRRPRPVRVLGAQCQRRTGHQRHRAAHRLGLRLQRQAGADRREQRLRLRAVPGALRGQLRRRVPARVHQLQPRAAAGHRSGSR